MIHSTKDNFPELVKCVGSNVNHLVEFKNP
jgi:hypothetical protein